MKSLTNECFAEQHFFSRIQSLLEDFQAQWLYLLNLLVGSNVPPAALNGELPGFSS